jgi:hypothetical protein
MKASAPDATREHAGWPVPVSALLLTAWLGASLYFTVVVTRAAFAVLPSRTLAGALVGQILPVLFDSGMLIGLLLVVAALREPRGAARSASFAGGIAIALLAAIARFVILTRIARLRLSMPAAIDSLSLSDPARRAFGQLHALSVGALGLAMLTGIVVAIVLAHTLSVTAND